MSSSTVSGLFGAVKQADLMAGPGMRLDIIMMNISAATILAGPRAPFSKIIKRLSADDTGRCFPVEIGKRQFGRSVSHRQFRCNSSGFTRVSAGMVECDE